MNEDAFLLNIIDRIYESATDPAHWEDTVLLINQYIGGAGTNLHLINNQHYFGEIGISSLYDRDTVAFYNKEIAPIDTWVRGLWQNPLGRVLHSTAEIPINQVMQTRAYQEFHGVNDFIYSIGALFAKSEQNIGMIGITRSKSCGDFAPEQIRKLQLLIPHLHRAFVIQQKIVATEYSYQSCSTALDHLSVGIILVNAHHRVLHHNHKIDQYLNAGYFNLRNGKIFLAKQEQQKILGGLIQSCIASHSGSPDAGGGFTLEQFDAKDHRRLFFSVYPYRASQRQLSEMFTVEPPVCIIFVNEDTPQVVPENLLKCIFNLSATEARVLSLLLMDLSTSEIALQLQVSHEAIRFHLKNIFRKTGARGQRELVNLCTKCVSPFKGRES